MTNQSTFCEGNQLAQTDCDRISGLMDMIDGEGGIIEYGENYIKLNNSSSVYGDEAHLPKKEGVEGNLLSPYTFTTMRATPVEATVPTTPTAS